MPSNWLAMDDNFPTFTGSESPQEQIAALHDYLFQMRQGLQYSMRNLTAENFNATALQQLTEEQKSALTKELQKLVNVVSQVSADINNLEARVIAMEKLSARVTTAEDAISYLQQEVEEMKTKQCECDIAQLQMEVQELQEGQETLEEQMTTAEADIFGLQEELQEIQTEQEKLSSVTQVAQDGSATIGGAGKKIYLVGDIYINGQLYESGGETT